MICIVQASFLISNELCGLRKCVWYFLIRRSFATGYCTYGKCKHSTHFFFLYSILWTDRLCLLYPLWKIVFTIFVTVSSAKRMTERSLGVLNALCKLETQWKTKKNKRQSKPTASKECNNCKWADCCEWAVRVWHGITLATTATSTTRLSRFAKLESPTAGNLPLGPHLQKLRSLY